MSDLISRQTAIYSMCAMVEHWFGDNSADEKREIVRELNKLPPSAGQEIIRCKDCKHYDGRPCGIVDWYNTEDDFCSRADMRGES